MVLNQGQSLGSIVYGASYLTTNIVSWFRGLGTPRKATEPSRERWHPLPAQVDRPDVMAQAREDASGRIWVHFQPIASSQKSFS
jgi:hypothetical protein